MSSRSQAELHILGHGEVGEEGKILKNHGDFALFRRQTPSRLCNSPTL
jgi:hypothetical protein